MRSVMLNFICATDNSMTIHIPRKRCISVLTIHAIRMRDRGAEKFGSLKDFEVYDIHKKEPWDKRIRSINSIGTVICLKQEINVETTPDRVIKVSVRSAPVFNGYLVGM
jgi:hypothetical protein